MTSSPSDPVLSIVIVPIEGGKILEVHRSKGQNVSEVPLNREARQYLEACLAWRRQQGGMFEPVPKSSMFLAQDSKSVGKRSGYKGLHRMVKKLGTIAGVEDINLQRRRHTFGHVVHGFSSIGGNVVQQYPFVPVIAERCRTAKVG